MFSDRRWLLPAALALTFCVALAGIWANRPFPTLENGGTFLEQTAPAGVALTGWEALDGNEWQYDFTVGQNAGSIELCVSSSISLAANDCIEAIGTDGERYTIIAEPGQRITLQLHSKRLPQAWLIPAEAAQNGFAARKLIQFSTLTAIVTMAAVVLALFYYKRQAELGYFLLYLVVLAGWAVSVVLSPVDRTGWRILMSRAFFSLTVFAPILLSAALTGVQLPKDPYKRCILAATTGLYLALSFSSTDLVRNLTLLIGMIFCLWLLCEACRHGQNAAVLMLFPGAVTFGARVWVLLSRLGLPIFTESFTFYLLRGARFYDLPFALGCMLYVCRRFALQFDRTEQLARELDQRVNERTRALTEESEARKSMMLNIFHDLRSPLFAVSSGLETIEAAPDALPILLPALRQRIEFLRRLTEDLFLAAKLEQKQVMLNEDRVALNEAAATVFSACESEAEKKGVTLTADTAAVLPVWGDEIRLEQIIQNIVTNAIHYTPAGGSVTVTCFAEAGRAHVRVRDTGCGIAPEDQSAVFDRYFHTSANTKHDSTGLGLTIAQELAHLHRGEITLESAVGEGSCFTLCLPLLED